MLTESEDGILLNLRFLDTTSSKVLIAVDGIIDEEQYRTMYSEIEFVKILTDEDYDIGQGRDFDRDKALIAGFSNWSSEKERSSTAVSSGIFRRRRKCVSPPDRGKTV
jgi:hypothetical protein